MVQGRDGVSSQGLPWEQIRSPFVPWQPVTPPVRVCLTFPHSKNVNLSFWFLYQEAFPVSFMNYLCQHRNNSNHLSLFFPGSLFLLQSDETGLVSFPFINRQIHFQIFSHAQHSSTARKQLTGVIKTPHWNHFCLFCVLQLFFFSFFLQYHGNIESKLGCQHHLKIDELFKIPSQC